MHRLLCCSKSRKGAVLLLLALPVASLPTAALAADPPPPPPAPSQATTSGQVTTGRGVETVSGTISDYKPTTPGIAFVKTIFPSSDENVHLVKLLGEQFFPSIDADYFFIVGANLDANTVALTRYLKEPDNTFVLDTSVDLSIQRVQTTASYQALFAQTGGSSGTPAIDPVPTVSGGGLVIRSQGSNGGNGRDGALFVPPSGGGNGGTPAFLNYVNSLPRTSSSGAGIEAASIGGNGGNGGDAYLSFFGGRPGGTGGPGGTINLTNAAGIQVSASGNAHHGIYAYSVSGRGGEGGAGFGAPSGGAGGGAFSGGNVTVTNLGSVFSNGRDAHGILAISRSGQGGAGGSQFGLFGAGGDGAVPGNGGRVTVTNGPNARVQTSGAGSHGIYALSVGGAGGAGGSSSNVFASDAGAGGGGGNGDNVLVDNKGTVVTQGNFSRGIFAQSVGGGGGSGGFGFGFVAIGGTGSRGGTAGEVRVTNSGSITTEGVRSDGIFAQSVAGSGGSGGNSGGLVALGGGAGPGGSGDLVSVDNSGSIVTSTNLQRSGNTGPRPAINIGGGVVSSQGGRGIVAQSIGGGGGDGGSAIGMVAVGGSGGSGNRGGTVTVANSGSITTNGNDAQGIFAQSVGGGGGNGGSATAVGAFFAVGVGGSGGSGAHGGLVNVSLAGKNPFDPATIETDGLRSVGIFAQSVGGGGGNGGGSTAISAGVGGSVSIALGGKGGTGGNGGRVELDDGSGGRADITTGDDFSTGVFLQSVGGGGGNGGYATSVAAAGGPVGIAIAFGKGGAGGAGGVGGQVLVGHRATPGGVLTSWDGSGPLQAAERGFNGNILTRGDFSPGFLAQSVGGGGGNGGASVTVAVSASLFGSAAIGVGLGGNAGAGSDGGRVVVGMAGNVTTEKKFSPGILVQSVGGGGGNGGSSIAASADFSAGVSGAVSVGIGGSGGAGSRGGDVSLATGQGLVWTKSESSTGIIAQSVGGGGGNGGFNVSGALAAAAGAAGAVSVGLGGEGGAGGESGTVRTYLQSDVITQGQNSTGILVQAVGGSGGSGGFNVSATLAGSGGGAGAISVGLGGKGGTASRGGTVEATATGSITTLGHSAAGLIAQSVGGGGGSGGFNVSAGIAGGGVVGGSLSVGLGGSAGAGGAGGKVTAVTGEASALPAVTTYGDNSTAILAQSVGGGGGNGGFNVSAAVSGAGTAAGSIGVGLGGSGGDGGDGGEVSLTVRNTVSTGAIGSGLLDPTGRTTDRTGHHSVGVLAQSIGGGGGNGGFNVTAGLAGSGTVAGGVGIGLGGDGGNGGRSASPVTLDMQGNIATLGDFASGLVAQSIGGGGGNGGFNVSAAISGAGTASGQVAVGMGGAGGGGGSATGLVTSALTGNVTTQGDHAAGVTAQSLGGGGGNGGFNIAGSIGGAGTGSASVAVGLGGSGGGGGSSGASGSDLVVINSVSGNVTTGGRNAPGVVAQSIGGGGGRGGLNVAGAISGAGTGSGAVSVGLGGSGGGGGNAAAVRNTVTGNVTTSQGQSIGVLAQSLGGGGGNGGFNVSGAISGASEGSGAVSVGLGGSGGNGGNSGASVNDVVVDNRVTGDVTTSGADSTAVLAQSIGGGGGAGGFNIAGVISGSGNASGAVSVGIGGSGGDGGHAGSIRNEVRGDVSTAARGSAGVVSQSIGGGGGNGAFNVSGSISVASKLSGAVSVGLGGSGGGGGDAGNVESIVVGDVSTIGADASGVVAQSLGGGGGNGAFNISGAISASGKSGAALTVGLGGFGGDGGQANRVDSTVSGDVTTRGARSTAILAQSLGGGGGNGGMNVSGSISLTQEGGGTLAVGIGGFGGGGGKAGDVDSTVTTATQAGTSTTGDDASAVVAQSIGGGGGNGAINVSAGLAISGKSGASLGVGVGGFGADAGDAGDVSANVTGLFTTAGARSNAVVVQSLGGGGGNGALNVTGQLGISTQGSSTQASVGVGGFGGRGGSSGKATLVRSGDTVTEGRDSAAILVQSLAGGGGNGGLNVSGGISGGKEGSNALQFGLGGFGGGGGDAAAVKATIRGNVIARGIGAGSDTAPPSLFSGGVVAQSVGGGGGSGGLNVSGGISVAQSSSGSGGKGATIGIGGFGGGGGDGGAVDLTLEGRDSSRAFVLVNGDQRAGAIAQSLGGSGGVGGINVSGGITTNSSLAFGLGGFGGSGGLARSVSANIHADVEVTGSGARGLLAQSIGGGGGAGGINVTGTANLKSDGDTSLSFGIGGFGGSGNRSDRVDAFQKGTISLTGANGVGVLAQSVAGGGGDGGLNVTANITNDTQTGKSKRLVAGMGGFAGAGANAGNVSVRSVGAIDVINAVAADSVAGDEKTEETRTTVFTSAGILAQSIGGGGGLGGMNISASAARDADYTAQFGMGGNGGAGGNAGKVEVNRGYEQTPDGEVVAASSIHTSGNYSSGIVAQSIGGGGGTGGMNFNFALNKESKSSEQASKKVGVIVSIGGSGADGGLSDEVKVRHNGTISTASIFSHGILAQSIGGGGGDSNMNLGAGYLGESTKSVNIGVGGANGAAGDGSRVDVDHVGTIQTGGQGSIGIKAQSIGGGGGSQKSLQKLLDPFLDLLASTLDSSSLTMNIGRKGGTGGKGGDVAVDSDGTITSQGDDAIGIFAQSVGGGGGDSGSITVGGDLTSGSASYGIGVAVGLDGGEGATGGNVSVFSKGEIITMGQRAHAIFAQSIGGGGGTGGTVGDKLAFKTVGKDENSSNTLNVSVGGAGGKGSFGQQVNVTNTARLFTFGDRSSAIWAQSVGGGGGSGGDFLQATFEYTKSGKTSRSLNVNVGGVGGTGARGGEVKVSNSNLLSTHGIQSFGIRAESIGGGGGEGGAVSQLSIIGGDGNTQSVDVSVGGSGGTGGSGGRVEVTNQGIIQTRGFAAEGIRAISTGGGGGNAGVLMNGLISFSGEKAQRHSLSVNVGGTGGTGGTGGDVSVVNQPGQLEDSGAIATKGDSAHGILAQSLGGGGGNGSSILSLTGMRSGKDSFVVGVNLGGKGGEGNKAGSVAVENSGTIITEGRNAYGILAQSTGGGGGNGGMVLSAAAAFGQQANTPLLSIGGRGGDGGDGGSVTVSNSGAITTSGDGSHGIVAQSIGGGGGNAGLGIAATNSAESFGLSNLVSLIAGAAGGGKGGTGGDVRVIQAGDVSVSGKGAQAIVAESINGGGGRLTVDFSGVVGLPGASTLKELFGYKDDEQMTEPAVASRLGGVDLSNMNAGKVSIETTGTFGVNGANSTSAFEQSLGGGGGSLFLSTRLAPRKDPAPIAALTVVAEPEVPIPFRISLGGTGGRHNSGGDIQGISSGVIVTRGLHASGLLSQSVGGGGGNAIVEITAPPGTTTGPLAVALGSHQGLEEKGGNINRVLNQIIQTQDDLSTALQVQSVGGGGGSASVLIKGVGSPDLDLLLGAINTNGSIGGDLTVTRSGSVSTFGRQSQGVSMQSVGGGGGRFVGSVESGLSKATITLGADPSFNNHAGDLNLNFKGDATTTGDYSPAQVLQSIGAGGGQAYLTGLKSATVQVGATDGSSGSGGDINLVNEGKVSTAGVRSDGLVLQSIGGGGSYLITDLKAEALNLLRRSDNRGNGGNIFLDQQGDITTSGDESVGILAQSLGGGGGVVDRLFLNTAGGEGSSGAITLRLNGNVLATGKQSSAVFAQSRGSQGRGDISIALAADKTIRVLPDGVGVTFSGGANNLFDNRGRVIAANLNDLPDGIIFKGFEGNETIINRGGGLIFGDLNLGGGSNQLINEEGAVAVLGREIFIGDGPTQTFLNRGIVSPGDIGIYTTLITGNYEQTPSGTLNLNLDLQKDQLDRLTITQQARLAGDLNVGLSSIPLVKPGQRNLVFAATEGGVADGGLRLNIAPSIVANYDIRYDALNAFLDVNIDFSGFGKLNANQTAIGNFINRIQMAGSSPRLASLISSLFSLTEFGTLKDIYNHLSPEVYTSTVANLILASHTYSDKLFSCDVRSAPNRFIAEGQCAWVDASTGTYTFDSTGQNFGYQASAAIFGAGLQWDLGGNWFAAFGAGRTSYRTTFGQEVSADLTGYTNQAGVSIKKVMGATKVGLSFVGGFGTFLSDRRDVGLSGDTADASQNGSFLASRLRVSHDLEQRDWYLRPSLDFGLSRVSYAGFNETGAGALNLVISGGSTTTSLLTPAIEIGGEIRDGDLLIRPRASVGYTHYFSDPSPKVSARLAEAPSSVSDFQVVGLLDQDYLNLAAGVDLIFLNGVSLKLGYVGQFSGNSTAHGGELRVAIPF